MEMIVKHFQDCKEIVAIDNTILRELLNPLHDEADLHLNYSIAHAIVRAGDASSPHKFKTSSEVYYILSGKGIMHIDEETKNVSVGDTIYIPPRAVQYIENTGKTDLAFLCIVYPAWKPEDEMLVESP